MDTKCFYIIVSFLLVSAHCSVDNSTKTDEFLEKLFTSEDTVQVQNLFVANCENIKEDVNSLTNSMADQDKQMQCMESSIEDIYDIANKTSGNVDKQSALVDNLVGTVASLNSRLVSQMDQSKTIIASLEVQGDKLETIIGLVKKFVTEKTETSVMACPEGFEEFHGKCYRFYGDPEKTWFKASKLCQKAGGFLAEPKTKLENDFIRDMAARDFDSVWLGGTDQSKEGEWRWQSDSDIISGFTNWYTNPDSGDNNLVDEPRNFTEKEDCILASARDNGVWYGKWFAFYCNSYLPRNRAAIVCQTTKVPSTKLTTKAWRHL